MATNEKKTAMQTYGERAKDIGALMGWLQDELESHEVRAKSDPQNWALAGDLAEVRMRLIDALAFISSHSAKTIQGELLALRMPRRSGKVRQIRAIACPSAEEAIRKASSQPGRVAVRLEGAWLVITEEEAEALKAAGASFTYIASHRGTVVTVPVNPEA